MDGSADVSRDTMADTAGQVTDEVRDMLGGVHAKRGTRCLDMYIYVARRVGSRGGEAGELRT